MNLHHKLTSNGCWTGADVPQSGFIERTQVNILVVDDNADFLLAVKEILAGPDRNVVIVRSGAEALRYLLEAEAAVILLDVSMQDLNGYETASLIRKRSRTRSLPIIFLTGGSTACADVAGVRLRRGGFHFQAG